MDYLPDPSIPSITVPPPPMVDLAAALPAEPLFLPAALPAEPPALPDVDPGQAVDQASPQAAIEPALGANLDDPKLYINRELSQLEFFRRVLEEAMDADAFAVALAQEMAATVITGDPEFKRVESLVDVLWL